MVDREDSNNNLNDSNGDLMSGSSQGLRSIRDDINVVQFEAASRAVNLEIIHQHLVGMDTRYPRSIRTKHCKAHFYTAVRPNIYLAHFTIKVNNANLPLVHQLKNATEEQFCKEEILKLQLNNNADSIDFT